VNVGYITFYIGHFFGKGKMVLEGTIHTESIDADLDLHVYNSSGDIVCSSTSYDSTWEGCDFAVTAGSTYVVKVYQVSRNVDFTYFALAWFGYW
jgi:hypothetical protein